MGGSSIRTSDRQLGDKEDDGGQAIELLGWAEGMQWDCCRRSMDGARASRARVIICSR